MKKEYSFLKWKKKGSIVIITFNRADTLNALTSDLQEEFLDLLQHLKDVHELRAIIITGEGKAFSAGGDLQGFLKKYEKYSKQGGSRELFRNRLPRTVLSIEVPLIAAINGPAVGGGLTLTLLCDFRIASEEAIFGAVFARVGLSPEYGSSFLLSRIVGLTRATEMILTAKIIGAKEALEYGLVSEVLPPHLLMRRAQEIAEEISSLPPISIRMCKRALKHGLDCNLHQAIAYEEMLETYCFSSLDHKEAVSAYLEKRSPKFMGY
jgi:enoyl-CoA hydratase/carnithine racemase